MDKYKLLFIMQTLRSIIKAEVMHITDHAFESVAATTNTKYTAAFSSTVCRKTSRWTDDQFRL